MHQSSRQRRRRTLVGALIATLALVAGLLIAPTPAGAADNPRQ